VVLLEFSPLMALLPFPLSVVVLVPLPDLFPVLGLGLGLLLELSPFMAWFPVPAPSPTGGPGFAPGPGPVPSHNPATHKKGRERRGTEHKVE